MNAPRQPEAELLEREVSIPDTSTIVAISRAEIDGQIATAHAFPRSVTKFIKEATELVTLNADMAEACIYALPRDGKTMTGPSARFAEVVAHSFGNNIAGARVVAEEGGFIVAQGVYHDLEKNAKTTMEVRRRITNKSGRRFSDDMIGVTGNAASSIAHRNAVLKGVPKALWLPIYEAARQVAIGDVTTLVDRRAKALSWFQTVGVTPAQVCARLDVAGIDDIGLAELELLTGLRTAIRDGSVTPEAAFATDEPEAAVPAPTSKNAVAGMAAAMDKRKKKAEPVDDGPTAQSVHDAIAGAADVDKLDEAADLIRALPEADRPALTELYVKRRDELSAT
ncbi:hypothetical protein ASD78_12120 [Lysobacter sp. Root667]|uniref:hypothetical protein n=1 Tax=Lysobacter sp. Root667 TaxID=1736581 RepID=UPI0006F3944A|nr:hypothetical protein [Lysobacter sp. Root667]KRA74234.1 hypothetical protein ASD78_12120 [Lysobacter sp. Root667]